MGHLTLELILWLLLAFLIGCVLGCLGRKLFGAAPEKPAPQLDKEPVKEPVKETVTETVPEIAAQPLALADTTSGSTLDTGVAKRPKGLAGARGEQGDDLQRISGVGSKLEKTLHSLGFFHFDQIANWSGDEAQWVDEHLRFKGRIKREEWIPQAKLLAAGNEAEFTKLYATKSSSSGDVSKFKSDEKRANPSTSTGTSALKSTDKIKPAPKAEPQVESKPAPKTIVATGVASTPKKLTAARGGKPDDLQQISGVGPKLEKTLQGLGFYHFDQIAQWTPDEVQWVDENLTFKGRIDREEWIAQCKLLAAGKMDEFTKLYGTGGLKSQKTGKSVSGDRTRKS